MNKRATVLHLAISVGAVGAIGWIDYATGSEFGFSLFYAIPVFLAGRSAGMWGGQFVGSTAVVAWALALALATSRVDTNPFAFYWNALIRAGFFAVVVVLATTQRELQRQKRAATKDDLTGVENRRGFCEFAAKEFERARRTGDPLTLAYIDCDNFKKINDTLGHAAGNAVLTAVGSVLRTSLRAVDVSARLGGDEFAVLLVGLSRPAAREVLDRLRGRLLGAMVAGGWHVTFSIGALTLEQPSPLLDEAMRRADELMYRAKRAGKNRVEYYEA